MNLAIIGAGAMGSLFAYLLTKSGQDPWLLDVRPDLADKVKREGLKIEGLSGDQRVSVKITTEPKDIGKADFIIVFVKSYDTITALNNCLPMVGTHTAFLTLQNGLGNIEKIGRIVGSERVMGGITSQGATVLGDGRIRHAGRGETIIGEVEGETSDRVKKIADIFNRANIKTEITEKLPELIWGKLLINVGINALTAITRLENGRLLDYPETKNILSMAVKEAIKVCRARGIKVIYEDPIGKVESVCKKTATNISSMLQDIKNGRKTEIEAINGAIVSEGSGMGVPTPINMVLTDLVMAIEKTADVRV